ncbi:MAG: EAL domain-containing protein [Bacilli bacterium]|nr:EAL domain-containing protein [Bacilli bacterium]
MIKKQMTRFETFLLARTKKAKLMHLAFIAISLFLIYFMVYQTGGIKFSYSHIMYIPIILTGLVLGIPAGMITGIIAGVLLGPFMPLDTQTMEPQVFSNWILRLLIFFSIGALSGLFSLIIRRANRKLIDLYTFNPETMIPNTNVLSSLEILDDENAQYLLTTILINNHLTIVELIGNEKYFEIVIEIYKRLKEGLKDYIVILQGESNKLWIAKKYANLEEDINLLIDILKQQILIEGIPLYVDISIGTTIVSECSELKNIANYRYCDVAARLAYKNGKPYEEYKPEHINYEQEYYLLSTFENALIENQVYLDYQPKIDLQTNKPIGFEALIRWNHPNKGLIPPDKFISAIEQTKLIHSLTNWVLVNVCKKIREFMEHNIDINISINISVKNLSSSKFIDGIIDTLNRYKISPKNIEIEITESILIENPKENISQLRTLLNNGIATSIDDFGTGYSSLQYLSELPLKNVKIDKYFIKNINESEYMKNVVETTIDLCHKLGYNVIAEGIEDEESLSILKSLECDYGQGYYISRPLASDKIIDWYKTNMIKNYNY